jgi:hypothetical protein
MTQSAQNRSGIRARGWLLDAVKHGVGFLVCSLSLVLNGLKHGSIVAPFPMAQHLKAPHPYRLKIRSDTEKRPQVQRFGIGVGVLQEVTQDHTLTWRSGFVLW